MSGPGSLTPCLFVDTSALVKLVAREEGSDHIRALHASPSSHLLATTRLAPVELAAALHRRAREGHLTSEAATGAAQALLGLVESRYLLVDVSASVVSEAIALLSTERLSPVDAIHLAAALSLARRRRDLDVALLSADRALNAAAARRKLAVREAVG